MKKTNAHVYAQYQQDGRWRTRLTITVVKTNLIYLNPTYKPT